MAVKNTPKKPEMLPAYLGGGQNITVPQAMPGQLEAIANQLSAGYGQPASAYMQQMEQLYNPMLMQFGQAPTPPAPTGPTTPPTGNGGGALNPTILGRNPIHGGLGNLSLVDINSPYNKNVDQKNKAGGSTHYEYYRPTRGRDR